MMTEQPTEPVVVTDLSGVTRKFLLTAAAGRRIARRLRAIAKDDADQAAVTVEAVFITAWECCVDRPAGGEDELFEAFTMAQVRDIVQRIASEHQAPADPTEPPVVQ